MRLAFCCRVSARLSASLIALTSIMSGSTALAQSDPDDAAVSDQTEEATEDAAEATSSNQIVVTGSRIQSAGFNAPTPLSVLSEDQINTVAPPRALTMRFA